jgi:hypothetical protein
LAFLLNQNALKSQQIPTRGFFAFPLLKMETLKKAGAFSLGFHRKAYGFTFQATVPVDR